MRPLFACKIAVVFVLLASCTENEQAVSKEEALAMAHIIDSAIANNKVSYYGSLLNIDILAKRIAASSEVGDLKQFKKGLQEGMKNSELGRQIVEGLKNEGGGYELVRHYERNKVQHLLYRFYGQGINYHDYELTKLNGRVCIADIFLYTSGEKLSKSMADLMMSIKQDGTAIKSNQVFAINQLKKLLNKGDYEEARKQYDEMPDTFKDHKFFQIFYLSIAEGLGYEEYEKALRRFEVRYRHEPNMLLSLIDAYIVRKEYDRALVAINQIDSMVGKDPYLDYYRYIFYGETGKTEEGLACLEKLYSAMPQYEDGALELLVNYLDAKNYDKARKLISEYRTNQKFDQARLEETLSAYPGFNAAEN